MFSLNATLPVFLVMVIGWALGQKGFLPKQFCTVADKLVFKVTLPVMLFCDMATLDLAHSFDAKFVLFCFAVTAIAIVVIWVLARRLILGSVPLFNIFAVIILTVESPQQHGKVTPSKLLYGVLTNPILDGIILGTLYSLLPFGLPTLAQKTLTSLSSLTTPLALLSIGASFEGAKAIKKLAPTMVAACCKLMVLTTIFIPIAVKLGFRDQQLIALLIMLGSPTTPSSYVMAKNMGHEGVLTASCVAATTLFSALSLTFWIFVLRSGGYIA